MRNAKKYRTQHGMMTIHEMAEKAGCSYNAMRLRLRTMTPGKALAVPERTILGLDVAAYNLGRKARKDGCDGNPYSRENMRRWAGWWAGWNDEDINLTRSAA